MSAQKIDLTSITLKVLFITGLLVASFWVVQPFLPAVVWAMTLVIATWPLMLTVQKAVGDRRGTAVCIMIAALLLVLILPFWLAVSTIVTNLDQIGDLARKLLTMRVPAPPDWLASVPLIGAQFANVWSRLSNMGVGDLAAQTNSLCWRHDPVVRLHRRQSRRNVRSLPSHSPDCRRDVHQG